MGWVSVRLWAGAKSASAAGGDLPRLPRQQGCASRHHAVHELAGSAGPGQVNRIPGPGRTTPPISTCLTKSAPRPPKSGPWCKRDHLPRASTKNMFREPSSSEEPACASASSEGVYPRTPDDRDLRSHPLRRAPLSHGRVPVQYPRLHLRPRPQSAPPEIARLCHPRLQEGKKTSRLRGSLPHRSAGVRQAQGYWSEIVKCGRPPLMQNATKNHVLSERGIGEHVDDHFRRSSSRKSASTRISAPRPPANLPRLERSEPCPWLSACACPASAARPIAKHHRDESPGRARRYREPPPSPVPRRAREEAAGQPRSPRRKNSPRKRIAPITDEVKKAIAEPKVSAGAG